MTYLKRAAWTMEGSRISPDPRLAQPSTLAVRFLGLLIGIVLAGMFPPWRIGINMVP